MPETKESTGRTKRKKSDGKARILSTQEVQDELMMKETKKKDENENKIKRKEIREQKKAEKLIEDNKRKIAQALKKRQREIKQIQTLISKNENKMRKLKSETREIVCLICKHWVVESDVPFMCCSCCRVFHANCLHACPCCY